MSSARKAKPARVNNRRGETLWSTRLGFIEQLNGVKLPATRLEVLIKMLRRSIAQYKNTNKFAAEKFEELLKKTLEE